MTPAYFLVEKFEFCPKNNKEEKNSPVDHPRRII